MTGTNVGDLMGDLVNPGQGDHLGLVHGWICSDDAVQSPNHSICRLRIGRYGHLQLRRRRRCPDNLSTVGDYIPHHQPFEYYTSTTNPHHLPPTSVSMIGKTDQANHQYDINDFFEALKHGHLPAVSFLKAPAYADGHPGYSDPLDEQTSS